MRLVQLDDSLGLDRTGNDPGGASSIPGLGGRLHFSTLSAFCLRVPTAVFRTAM